MHLNHDFYFVIGKQCRTENAYTGHQYKLTNVVSLSISYKLVMKLMKFC